MSSFFTCQPPLCGPIIFGAPVLFYPPQVILDVFLDARAMRERSGSAGNLLERKSPGGFHNRSRRKSAEYISHKVRELAGGHALYLFILFA